MIILGIDPGIAIVGYGVIEYTGNKFRVLDYNAVTTPKEDSLAERLKSIYEQIGVICDTYHPDFMSIEELFYNNNQKTVISVAHGRGVCILAAANRNIPVFEYTPLQVKQAVVGYGRADKKQIQQMVKAILNLNAVPKPDDVADGLALAICHAHSHKMQQLTGINGKQTV